MAPQQRFVQRALGFGLLHDLVVQQVIQRRQPRRTTDRVSAEGGDMSQNRIGLQRIHDFAPRHERPQRHAAAERLGQAYDVGRNAVFEHGEQFARAAHTGLYLVEDQQGAHFVAPPPQGFQIARRGRPDARFALYGFGQHAGRAPRDAVQRVEIVEFDRLHVGQQGPERPFPLFAFGRPHHAHRTVGRTVVGAAHGDQLRAARETLGQL